MSPRRLVIRWRQYDEAGAIVREYVEAEEYERIEAALSRYADHDRACDARENALYACTCGFVEMVEQVFPPVPRVTDAERAEALRVREEVSKQTGT